MPKVLLAHADSPTREGLRGALKSHRGVEVLAAVDDGQEAVNQAIQSNPDVVVVSVSIPVMSGIEVARAVLEVKPDIAVLMIAGHESGSTILRAFRAGALGYLLEDSALSEIAKAVRAVASGKRYLGVGVEDKMLDSLQASRSDLDALSRLNVMERQILRLVAEGKSNTETATLLGLSPRTVETYRAGLTHKLGLVDMPSLVKFAIRQGIVGIE